MAQRKLYEAEADVETKNWEKKNSDFSTTPTKQLDGQIRLRETRLAFMESWT